MSCSLYHEEHEESQKNPGVLISFVNFVAFVVERLDCQ
jgi:hypothetical protein